MNKETKFDRLGGISPIGDKFRPLSKDSLHEIELSIGGELSPSYRDFMAEYGSCKFNGDSDDNPYVYFRSVSALPVHVSEDQFGIFEGFYGESGDEGDGFGLTTRIEFFKGRMPTSMIPIGSDFGAGQICLGVSGKEKGKIYYWDQANEPLDEDDYQDDFGVVRPQSVLYQNVHLIANSFVDFLESLTTRGGD